MTMTMTMTMTMAMTMAMTMTTATTMTMTMTMTVTVTVTVAMTMTANPWFHSALVDPAKLSTEVISQLLLLMLVPVHLNRWDEGELRPESVSLLSSLLVKLLSLITLGTPLNIFPIHFYFLGAPRYCL